MFRFLPICKQGLRQNKNQTDQEFLRTKTKQGLRQNKRESSQEKKRHKDQQDKIRQARADACYSSLTWPEPESHIQRTCLVVHTGQWAEIKTSLMIWMTKCYYSFEALWCRDWKQVVMNIPIWRVAAEMKVTRVHIIHIYKLRLCLHFLCSHPPPFRSPSRSQLLFCHKWPGRMSQIMPRLDWGRTCERTFFSLRNVPRKLNIISFCLRCSGLRWNG